MGHKFAIVVIWCLTCLDPGNTDFGDENRLEDSDSIVVGVKYSEKVCVSMSVLTCRADFCRFWQLFVISV